MLLDLFGGSGLSGIGLLVVGGPLGGTTEEVRTGFDESVPVVEYDQRNPLAGPWRTGAHGATGHGTLFRYTDAIMTLGWISAKNTTLGGRREVSRALLSSNSCNEELLTCISTFLGGHPFWDAVGCERTERTHNRGGVVREPLRMSAPLTRFVLSGESRGLIGLSSPHDSLVDSGLRSY